VFDSNYWFLIGSTSTSAWVGENCCYVSPYACNGHRSPSIWTISIWNTINDGWFYIENANINGMVTQMPKNL